ncbi:SAM-dependent methyltransferase [Streptomyces sp. RB6PN25]|uniref:SAM-dependent methyltransferase n=1 Tax=Streptomyces humicola TaxID=2953240 RepID=A0ABT1Q6D8_9ACTN|nr:N-6 DNA methylase [Streptomyces humicola]MCQ4084352.1 SAM-dependent methyltransferase [Streptomyces humicola]
MPKPSAQVTAAEISRLAGVTRATVSNWRRRHADFPAPVAGTDASPLYDLEAVRAWLAARGHVSSASPAEELRTVLRLHTGTDGAATRLLPLVLAAAERDKDDLAALSGLPDADLAARCQEAVGKLTDVVPDADAITYTPDDASLLRALLHCVHGQSAQAALDVLAERELEDSAASGAYQTPQRLADLMSCLLAPGPGPYPARVLDPACGSGSLLAAARSGATCLFGQDSIPVQAQRSAVRLHLSAPRAEVAVRAGDSLRADAFPGLTVDAVLCNPPYGDRDWGHDDLAYDPRWAYGLPPRAESELAWVQHALAHLAPGGLAVMLLPPATASRASGRRVRAELLRASALRAVIALPPGAATPFHIGLHLWILQRPRPDETGQHTVLFIDTAADQRPSPAHTLPTQAAGTPARSREGRTDLDWTALSDTVLAHWRLFAADPAGFADEPGVARAVPVIELLDDLVDITPTRHVRTSPSAADPAAIAKRAEELRRRLKEGVTILAASSGGGGWQPAGEGARSWRTATIADLTRGGALTLHRAAPGTRGAQESERPGEGEEYAGRAVLTGYDVATGGCASGDPDGQAGAASVLVEEGDILLSSLRTVAPGAIVRVADATDAGCLLGPNLHLFRPDPERLDSWFLAGFLSAEDNINAASTGTTTIQIDPRRLRLPLLPLAEQRRYGKAFRRLYELRAAARQAADLATATADLLGTGLTGGALLPPGTQPESDSA